MAPWSNATLLGPRCLSPSWNNYIESICSLLRHYVYVDSVRWYSDFSIYCSLSFVNWLEYRYILADKSRASIKYRQMYGLVTLIKSNKITKSSNIHPLSQLNESGPLKSVYSSLVSSWRYLSKAFMLQMGDTILNQKSSGADNLTQ